MIIGEINAYNHHCCETAKDISNKWKSVIDIFVMVLRVFDLEIVSWHQLAEIGRDHYEEEEIGGFLLIYR